MLREPFVATVPARYARELLAAIKAALANIDADIAGGATVAPFMLDDAAEGDTVVVVAAPAPNAIRKSA